MIPVSRPSVGQEELDAIAKVFATGWLGHGVVTEEFEQALKKKLACAHVVAVSSGTAALHLACASLGLGLGDEVLVPSLTFASSIQAILAVGATPVFCESDETTGLLDLDDAARRITTRTRAVMPVHYAGQACDMDRLLALAARHDLRVIEDAAHAFGSRFNGRLIGTHSAGQATCFSFDPVKTMTCGEGGAVALADGDAAERIRCMRTVGMERGDWRSRGTIPAWRSEVVMEGFRYHLPNMCAAIGLAQLKKVDEAIGRRRMICQRYDVVFASLRNIRCLVVDYAQSSAFMYVVKVDASRREAFMAFLKQQGMETGVHYPANHLQPFFRRFASEPLPRTERLCQQIVTLPLYRGMTDEEVATVIEAVRAFDAAVAATGRSPTSAGNR